MAWIESNQELGRHPKMKRLSRILDINIREAVGMLHFMWWWALDFAQDGSLEGYESYDIADAVMWDGDANALLDALISAGFIDNIDGNMFIHDWHDYAGRLIDKRVANAERARMSRNRNKLKSNSANDDTDTYAQHACDVCAPCMATVQYSTVQDSTNNTPLPPRGEDDGLSSGTQHSDDDKQGLQEQRFDEFWKSYPRKVGKEKALKAWRRLKPNTKLHERIMTAIERAKTCQEWTKESGQYIPHPTTWLNRGGWEDEYITSQSPHCSRSHEKSYQRHDYTESDLAHLGVNLDDE